MADEVLMLTPEQVRERMAQIAQAEEQRAMKDEQERTAELEAMLTRIRERHDEIRSHRLALPCCSLAEAGRISEAADACVREKVSRTCEFRQFPEWCALEREGAQVEAVRTRLLVAGVPNIHAALVLASFPGNRTASGARVSAKELLETDAMGYVRSWLADLQDQGARKPLLVLSGLASRGKTVAACWALARLDGGLFMPVGELSEPKTALERACAASALVVDDLGTEYRTPWICSQVERLIVERHAADKPTILTTNLGRRAKSGQEPQFAERYGVRVDERLSQSGLFYRCGGASLRTPRAKDDGR